MKNVLVIPFAGRPDAEFVESQISASGNSVLYASAPYGIAVEQAEAVMGSESVPLYVIAGERVRWMVNRIFSNLARFAAPSIADDDRVLFIHQTVIMTPELYDGLSALLNSSSQMVSGIPKRYGDIIDYTSRCLMFTGSAFKRFMTRKIPNSVTLIEKTSVQFLMEYMDAAGIGYTISNLRVQEKQ